MKSILNIKNKILKILGNKVTVFAVVLFIPLFFNVYAQTSTLSATPTAPDFIENKEIQNLKEKIATKVAELREKNVKAVSGVVQEFTSSNKLTGTKIMIKTWKDENFQIVVDPVLTKFFQITGEQKKEVNLKSLKKNIYIIVFISLLKKRDACVKTSLPTYKTFLNIVRSRKQCTSRTQL